MRLISYDVGIKNLAYCVLEYDDKNCLSILDWNVLSLLEQEAPDKQCSQTNPGKNKKAAPTPCGKIAKYQKNGQCYCDKHAKKCAFIIPTKKHTKPHLKKLKVPELEQLSKSLFLFGPENQGKPKKDEIVDKIAAFYDKQCLEPIIKKKAENAGDTDLILIGKRMKQVLNASPIAPTITHVIIENQISPIATRMKTLQGMLTQYYIDHIENVDITFVSSVHKLKQFVVPTKKNDEEKTSYKEHKVSGIDYCSRILQQNPGFSAWQPKLDTKKKDDLADCFLQGLWYFKQKNIITYADDLKINIVSLS
jgi:hypothetical protein